MGSECRLCWDCQGQGWAGVGGGGAREKLLGRGAWKAEGAHSWAEAEGLWVVGPAAPRLRER